MKILILSVARRRTPHYENISDVQIELIMEALVAKGHQAMHRRYVPKTVARVISEVMPDLIFNLAYGFRDVNGAIVEYQHDTMRRLEGLFPHIVGSPAYVQELVQDKRGTASILRNIVRSPREITPMELTTSCTGIVKPRYGACHRDVYIVRSKQEYEDVVAINTHEILLQEYIEGTEYTVGILKTSDGVRIFTPIEVVFGEQFRGGPRLMDWNHFRWTLESRVEALPILGDVSKHIFMFLGMQDYARFDFRVHHNVPILLDVNALPNLSPFGSLLPYMAEADGMPFSDLIIGLVESAISRIKPLHI